MVLKAEKPTSRLIPLTQEKFAIVDEEDYEQLSQYSWFLHKKTWGGLYAATNTEKVDGKKTTITMQRFILNAQKGQEIDHKNGNGLDNRKENIRFCTRSQNLINKQKQNGRQGIPFASRFKGVSYKKRDNLWVAQVDCNGKKIYLGRFKTEEEAAIAYNKKAQELYGCFAVLNKL